MKSLSALLHKGKRSQEAASKTRAHELMHPGREWIVGLSAAVLLFVSGSLYLGYDFWDQYQGIDEQIPVDGTVVRYRKQDAAHFLELYRAKKETFEALRADKVFQPAVVVSTTPEVATSTAVAAPPLAEEVVAQ